MKISVQPPEIRIPSACPFQYDLLERQKVAEVLANITERIEGPCVLAVDAAWGAGKTTFLKMWSQLLRNRGFLVVAFNAWETDFTDQPFLALSAELIHELESCSEILSHDILKNFKRAGINLAKSVLPQIAALIAGPASPVAEATVNQILTMVDRKGPDEYQEAKESILHFRQTLSEVALELSRTRADVPLVVLIDELDRCRPSYAIELLEVTKHFFLSGPHSVCDWQSTDLNWRTLFKACMVLDFDATGYLQRFGIDLDFRLPEPDRDKFVVHLLESTGLVRFFGDGAQIEEDQDEVAVAGMLLRSFLRTSEPSRQVCSAPVGVNGFSEIFR